MIYGRKKALNKHRLFRAMLLYYPNLSDKKSQVDIISYDFP